MRQIAIVGLAPSTHDDAPWDDPSWEKWGLPWDNGYWPKCGRLFEMHDQRLWHIRPGYHDRLSEVVELGIPLYMQAQYIDGATAYPFADVGTSYFNSSLAYMMALAISEQPDRIGLWGVDMKADDEYAYQRPNMEFLIGLAMGKGIDVLIPEQSPLLKFNGDGIQFEDTYPAYVGRYGWLG